MQKVQKYILGSVACCRDTWYHCEIVTVAVIKYSSPNFIV